VMTFKVLPLSQVFEHCLLKQLQSITKSENDQFGFKKGVGCSHAIYSAGTIVDSWVSQGFTANLCAIDLTKAFDKVNHHAVFMKLIRRNILVEIIEIIEICSLAALLVSDGETLGLLSLQLSLVCDKALYFHPFCLPYI